MMSEPPIYTMRDLREWVTLSDVMDAHELLNVKAANAEKIRRKNAKPGS